MSEPSRMKLKKQKLVFLVIAVLFLALLFYASYDIASRTTFPGSKSQLKERIDKKYLRKDSISSDSGRFIKK
jgi:hypothetical protein